ncbi:MAG: protein kinase [Myxococcales bacterium]|nr:protein kinase [Myxococcales bacterium]
MRTLPPEVREAAARLAPEFGAHEELDPHDLVALLHRRGEITPEQLRDAMMSLHSDARIDEVLPAPPDPVPPTILGPLGSGAMGQVLIAKDEGLDRVVAIKELHPELADNGRVRQRFYKEAQVTARLDHPSIVPIYGLVQSERGLAYAMKLVSGTTLEAYLDEAREQWRTQRRDGGTHSLSARLERFLKVCGAVAYAHQRGVVHRDLKPENIMVGTFGEVLVMDWGIAKLLGEGEDAQGLFHTRSSRKFHGTQFGSLLGTPRYMSPEQARGANDTLDERSDQYALGLILSEVVTLKPAIDPFLSLEECLDWARAARLQPMKHLHRRGRIPRELKAIVAKATQRDPQRRYASVEALADDVRRFLRDESVLAKPDNPLQSLVRWVGRNRGLVLVMLLLSLLATVLVGVVLLVGAAGTVELQRRYAVQREAAITERLAATAQRARGIDERVRRVEAALTGLSFITERALLGEGERVEHHGFDPVNEFPPDAQLKPSDVYGTPVVVNAPSYTFVTRPGGRGAGAIAQLTTSRNLFTRVILDGAERDRTKPLRPERAHQRIAQRGAPVAWVRVATDEGLAMRLPGGSKPSKKGSDPRKEAWYQAALGQSHPVWTGPRLDPDGMGVVVVGSLAAYRRSDAAVLGVSALDLKLDALARELQPDAEVLGAWLVDENGRRMVWWGMGAREMTAWDPQPLPYPQLLQRFRPGEEGWVEADGVIAWFAPVPSLGWSLVVVAEEAVIWQ